MSALKTSDPTFPLLMPSATGVQVRDATRCPSEELPPSIGGATSKVKPTAAAGYHHRRGENSESVPESQSDNGAGAGFGGDSPRRGPFSRHT